MTTQESKLQAKKSTATLANNKEDQPSKSAEIDSANSLNLDVEFSELKQLYSKNVFPSAKERRSLLNEIKNILVKNEQKFVKALSKDYGYRSEFDSQILDIIPTVNYINYVSKNIPRWMKREKRHAGLMLAPSRVEVLFQPLGVVGVVVPWNFPINLALGPAVSAIGAGNKVMVKLSEFVPNINRALIEAFKPLSEHIRFYEGEVEISSKFSSLPFDHLLFTGSTNVGRIVAKAAAQNLTPITLELGGKSPTIVTENANLDTAVDNIIIGKTFNSGQICVAPDYLLIHESLKDEFVSKFVDKVRLLYKDEHKNDLTHIISKQHFARLNGYLEDAQSKGAKVIKTLEPKDKNSTQIYPTLVTDITDDMQIMKDEIFGSLLPVITYQSLDEVLSYIIERPRPLALYIMSDNKKEVERIITKTHSGGVSVNDTVMHVGADDAPFGGIGDSGMGQYHGREGFLTFSKSKTVLRSKSYIPKNRILLKHRDGLIGTLKRLFLR